MKDIERILTQIENRVIHIHAIMKRAINMMLARDPKQHNEHVASVTVEDLERYVRHWQFLVPDTPDDKAGLLNSVLQKYPFSTDSFPGLTEALGANNDAVKAAYQDAFGKPLQIPDGIARADYQDTEAASDLLREIDWMYLKRGEQLYTQGTNGDYLYGIVDGRFEVTVTKDALVSNTATAHIGEMLGEEAIISQLPYSATVTVLRDSDVIRLHREGFQRLIAKYPAGMMRFAYQVMQRQQRLFGLIPTAPDPQSVVILHASAGTKEFSKRLAEVFAKQMTTILFQPDKLEDHMPEHLHVHLEDIVDEYDFVDWLQEQDRRLEMMIFEGDVNFPNWTRRAIEQADHILIVGRVGEAFNFAPMQDIINRISHPELEPKRELIILHETRRPGPYGIRDWIKSVGDVRHHHVALDNDAGFERVIRFLLGKAVGVVFGGGGMRGACHHGIIQALNEAGITADVVGGTSAGSIVAAQYALGWPVDEMFQRTKEDLMRKDVLMNLTFPIVAFNTGKNVMDVYQRWFGDVLTEDLWTTCFTVSANLTLTYQSTNQYGPLWRNVRYSTSIAGLFPPVPDEDGYLHIDGGVYDNTPSDVMREFVGAGTVIAGDLGFTLREPVQYDYGPFLNGWQVLWSRINPFSQSMKVITITDVLMQSNALAARAATTAQVAASDLIINPGVPDIGLFDFGAADRLYKAGYDKAKEMLNGFSIK